MADHITRKEFFTRRKPGQNYPIHIKSDWPTQRVADIHKRFLHDRPIPYYPPNKKYNPVSISPSGHGATVDWDESSAAHLLRRTLFAPTLSEILSTASEPLENTVTALLADQAQPIPPGDWVNEPPPQWDTMTDQEILDLISLYYERLFLMVRWWMNRMASQPMSITENMTLFWHDHFATALGGVLFPQAMYEQNAILREHCLGNFRELLRRVSFGPAMMIWLDTNSNTVSHPNENFARELCELFTLGVDHYTQTDVVEAARAFTGYSTNGVETNYVYDQQTGYGWHWDNHHDFSQKTFLGQTGNFDGDDIIEIILQLDVTAIFICEKIYRWFIYEVSDANMVNEMATIFRNNDYEIKPVIEFMLSSDHFFDVNFRGSVIRNPLSLTQGIIRMMGLSAEDFPDSLMIDVQYFLGMIPLDPPNVSGWTGYRSWLNSITLPIRKYFTSFIIDGQDPFGGDLGFQPDVIALAQTTSDPNSAITVVHDLARLFFPFELNENLQNQLLGVLLEGAAVYDWDINDAGSPQRLRNLIKYMMRKPEFQLL